MTFTLKARGEGDLKHRYRPQRLDELAPTAALTRLQRMAKDPKSQVYLFEGPSGTGKTSAARIIARASVCTAAADKPCLQCDQCQNMENSVDFIELNIADLRKIDDIREIIEGMRFMPMQLNRKIYIFDECFPAETKVWTTTGSKSIRNVCVGETVETLSGASTVKRTFTNKVDVTRVCRVNLSSGGPLFTTLQHRIFTNRGWVEAGNLQKRDCVFRFRGNLMDHEQSDNLQSMRPTLHSEVPIQQAQMLFQELCPETPERNFGTRTHRDAVMPFLQKRIPSEATEVEHAEILQPVMRCTTQNVPSRVSGSYSHNRGCEEDLRVETAVPLNRRWFGLERSHIHQNERMQSSKGSNCLDSNNGYEGEERYSACVVGRPWRQRSVDHGAVETSPSAGQRLETRVPNLSWKETTWVSDVLQSRSRPAQYQVGGRDRWSWTQLEEKFLKRPEEDGRFIGVRVESLEVYERGRNDEAFSCIISDQDRRAGFVTFYDLEIDGHPSYTAEGVIVHNCHQLTDSSQQVLLKTFEEPNEGLLIFMCTTHTKGLDKALLDRAEKVSFKSLDKTAAIEIVDQVVKAAGRDVSKEIRGQLIDSCEGSARALLNSVQAYLDGGFDPETVAEEDGGADVKELALALVAGDWPKTADILKRPSVKAKPEGIRIAVESFVRAMVLNSNTINVRAVAALTTLVGTVSTEPGISQYNRFVFKCVKACQNKT